jgi:MFS transporter, AAHS family, 4-hydroxybenzoate transporter
MEDTDHFDIPAFIDRQPLGRFHVILEILCIFGAIMDGLDLQIVGYVGPSIAKEWALPPGSLGPVFGGGLIGMVLGATLLGMLGDRSGRKTIILCSLGIFGVSTMLSATAHSTQMLLFWRFCTGFGLGGIIPNTAVLISEYMPKRLRATMFMLVSSSVSLGAALGGILTAFVIPRGGWQWVFISCGLITLTLLPFFALLVPESLRRLSLRTGQNAQIDRILKRIDRNYTPRPGVQFIVNEPQTKGFPIGELFREGRALTTICLCTALFMNMMALYFLSNWLPTLIHDLGYPVTSAVLATTGLQVGGILGSVTVGFLSDHFRPTRVLAVAFLIASVFTAAIAFSGSEFALVVTLIFFAGFGCNGAQLGAIYVSSISYPTSIRSTGVGWALGTGRLGAVAGPVIGGFLLAFGWPFKSLFVLASIPPLVGALATVTLGREARKLKLAHAMGPARLELKPAE